MNKRNYRIVADAPVTIETTAGTITYSSGDHSEYETDCKNCGAEYTAKGIFGGLFKLCPTCLEKKND